MCISSTTGTESRARTFPAAFVLAILILTSAAPAGAALPEVGLAACRRLGSELIYIGQAGEPFHTGCFTRRSITLEVFGSRRRLHALPPGSYIVGHQIISPHVVMPGQKLPPKTFYPGTPDRSAAIPIVVGTATQHDGIDFVVEAEP